MSCCLNDLGSFPHNKDINTGVEASVSGMHCLSFEGPNFSKFSKYVSCESGEDIVIPQGTLNEDFTYNFTIAKPDGTLYSADDCSNYALKTFINKVACDDIQYL